MSTSSPTLTVQGIAPLSIHLKNHCILCLQPESPTILQTILSTNPSSLHSFQPLIYYLTCIDPSDPLQMSEYISSQKYFPICTSPNLPPMCASCYPILGEMYRLHNSLIQIQHQLQKQIQLARKIVKSTVTEDNRLSARSNIFKSLGVGLRSILSKEEMKGLRYFIENFHGLIIQAENKYKFPSPPPPQPDPHLPPPVSQAALMSLSYPVKFEWSHDNHLSTSTSPAPSVSSSSTSTPTPNQEIIIVDGIDTSVKFEVESEEDLEGDADNFEDETVNVVIVAKQDVDTGGHEDNPPQHYILEPDDYPDEEEEEVTTSPVSLPLGGGGGSDGGNIWKVDSQPCDICNKILDLPSLRIHLRGHLSRDPVSCDVCSQVFLSKSKLICHYLEMNTGSYCRERSRWFKNLRYSCELCGGCFGSEMDLRNYVFRNHEVDTRLDQGWQCNLCNERFRTFEGLDFHTNWHICQAQKRKCWGRLKMLLPPGPNKEVPLTTPTRTTPTQTSIYSTNSSSSSPSSATISAPQTGTSGSVQWASGSVQWAGGHIRNPKCLDLTCDFCGKQCIGNSALLKHVKQVHKKGGAVKRPRN